MAHQLEKLDDELTSFIERQKIFFLATCGGQEITLSPRGFDCFKVLGPKQAMYFDYYGSTDRTKRDVLAKGEITVMFTAFEGPSLILRLFCKGEPVERNDERFSELVTHFPKANPDHIRHLMLLHIYCAETSCGETVPLYRYEGQRPGFVEYMDKYESNAQLAKDFGQRFDLTPDLSPYRDK